MSAAAMVTQGSQGDVIALLFALLPVWLLGTLVGLLLPRPKWLDSCSRSTSLLLSTPPGTFIRQTIIFCHGAFIVRDVWRYVAFPGTFHALLGAVVHKLRTFFPLTRQPTGIDDGEASTPPILEDSTTFAHPELDWYVTATDLEFFKLHAEAPHDDKPAAGYGRWEPLMDLKLDRGSYTAWRRKLPTGKTEYKSVTLSSGCTAEEVMDFYLDDPTRTKWDPMISHHETLESVPGQAKNRLQAVLWRRSFPFSFISAREYVLGRRLFREGGDLYGITKAVEHPAAPRDGKVVRVDAYHSMWRSRTVACPFGSAEPACETLLLHHEDMRVPENLARLAIRHGMANYVKKMVPSLKDFVDERRGRGVDPCAADPAAYGLLDGGAGAQQGVPPTRDAMRRAMSSPLLSHQQVAAAGGKHLRHSSSSTSVSSCASSVASDSVLCAGCAGHRRRRPVREEVGPLRRLGTLALAAGVAVAVGRTASGSSVRRHQAATTR